MDNPKAVEGIRKVLSKLETEHLLGLAATVTQGLLKNKLHTRAGAVEAIFKYSPDFPSILNRKIVTRDILFEYTHDNNIPVNLPATKNDLVELILQYWNLHTTKVLLPSSYSAPQTSSYESVQQPQENSELSSLAFKFAEWFYSMMNSNAPMNCEHFWMDAKLKLNLISSSQIVNQDVEESVAEIINVLYKTKCEHNLYFNPNFLSNGIQGRINQHGFVVVLVCGTLHSNNLCVGVFEQVFMLARDPFSSNNWKIKNMELNLRSKEGVVGQPSLQDNELTCNLLALPES